MNDNVTEQTPQADPVDLRAECQFLRKQVWTLLVMLTIVSGTLTIYLLREWSYERKDLRAFKPQAVQIIEAYKREAPAMGDFVRRLSEFGKTHPDFAAVLAKYNITTTNAAPPAATGAPVSTPPPTATKAAAPPQNKK